jgi:hypothetical protein
MEFIVDFRVVQYCLGAGEGANDLAHALPVDEIKPIERWTVLPTHIAPPSRFPDKPARLNSAVVLLLINARKREKMAQVGDK